LRKLLLLAAILALPFVLLEISLLPAPLPAPAPLDAELPPASPPDGMAIFQLPTGVTHRSTGFAYRGGSFFDKRDFAMTAVLIKHPKGDLLIDTGFGCDIDRQFEMLPFFVRYVTTYEHGKCAADQLRDAGYDMTQLKWILLTHAHWDHVSGLPDFPGATVLVPEAEREAIDKGGAVMELARSFRDVRYAAYKFGGGPYLGFPTSSDVYKDGSIVLVPAPGHTPGSVIVFVTLPGEKRYALVGDLVWQLEGILQREERPWLQRRVADADPEGVRANLLRVAAIAAKFPEITIVPAHDLRGFADMPKF